MKYKEINLEEFVSDKPVAFNPPKKMLCWDDDRSRLTEDNCQLVDLFLPAGYDCIHSRAVTVDKISWKHCAEIPKGEE